ncbi:hypothetical protein LL947_07205 [Halomonas sp. BLK-85]
MSLERLYQKYAGQPETPAPATKWPYGHPSWPDHGQPETRMVTGLGHNGHGGHGKTQGQEDGHGITPMATAQEVETMLANLRAVGRDLREVEGYARFTLRKLTRAAAAEVVAVMDDLFSTAPTPDMARTQCRRVLSDPQALAAAKAVWPDLATLAIQGDHNAHI